MCSADSTGHRGQSCLRLASAPWYSCTHIGRYAVNPQPKKALARRAAPHIPQIAGASRVVTLAQFWMGRDAVYRAELTEQIARNAAQTVERVNRLLAAFAADGVALRCRPDTGSLVASGWRPVEVNARVPMAVPDSPHIDAAACDLYDPHNELDAWCVSNLAALAGLGLWLEHPEYTDGWCHVQIRAPRCGNRVFRPW